MDGLNSNSDFRPHLPSRDQLASSSSSDEDVLAHASSLQPKRQAGRLKFRETRHPLYRGVRRRNAGKWVCEVRVPNKKSRIWLGTFPTPVMAARAHDVAVLALRGPSAGLNFADSARLLPMPVSKSAKDIQRAAAEAAEAFRPQSNVHSGNKPDTDRVEPERPVLSPENVLFVDEFAMHKLLDDMAEGLLLSPPSFHCIGSLWDDVDSYVELPLWSYSI